MNKHLILYICILTLMTQHSIAMEDNYNDIKLTPIYQTKKEATTNLFLNDLVTTIDTAINKKHGTNNFITQTFSPFFLSESTMLDTLDTIRQCYPTLNPTEDVLDALYEKNNYFKKSIDCLSTIALNHFKNATSGTLSVVENFTQQQEQLLNFNISLLIKTYIIQKAYNQIKHSYDIKLAGHTDSIWCYDISPTTHLAATGSTDKTTRIWDLKTGTQTRILQNVGCDIVHFNPDGSRLATTKNYSSPNKKAIVKEWNTNSGNQLWSIESKEYVENIEYAQNTPNYILAILSLNDSDNIDRKYYTQTLVLLNENIPCPLGTIPLVQGHPQYYHRSFAKSTGNYYAEHPGRQTIDNTTLYVTKNNCRELYLCQQAIHNTQRTKSLPKVTQSQSYNTLTDYEKQMVQIQIKEKTAALLAMKKHNIFAHELLKTAGL